MSLSLRGVMKPGAACVGPECMGCASANCMSSGGKVMGVHEDMGDYGGKPGVSPAGHSVRKMKAGTYKQFETVDPKQSHERVLKEMKMLPKPKLYAKGGPIIDADGDMDGDQDESMESDHDMDNGDDGGDSAMLDSCAGELIDALERKDKGQILEAIKAIVLSVR